MRVSALVVIAVCLLFFPLVKADFAQAGTVFAYLTDVANVSITNLAVIPNSSVQGSLIDFTLTLQNTGGVSTNFTANVSILSANGSLVENISFTQTSIGPVTSMSLTKTWNSDDKPVGTYVASGVAVFEQAGVNVSTNTFTTNFTLVASGGGAPPGGGGAMQEEKPEKLPPVVKPVKGAITFTKTTVLREILAGTSSFESFTLKNTDNVERHVSVSIGGIPQDWVSIKPVETILLPGEERAINVAVVIPEKALVGDYLGKINVQDDIGTSLEFMALRVKPKASFAGPTVTRTVVIDRNTGDATVTLRLRNVGDNIIPMIKITDAVPVSLATSELSLSFLDKQGVIEESDGRLQISWEFSDFNPRDLAIVSYKIKAGALDEYSTYFVWPVKQVVVSEKIGFQNLLRVTDFHVPMMTAGKPSVITAKLFYAGADSLSLLADLDLPIGFSQSPEAISKTIGPSGTENLQFEVTPPKGASGSYQISLRLKSQKGELETSAVAIVQGAAEQEISPLAISYEKDLIWVLVVIVVILSAVFAYIIISGKRSEQKEAEMRFKESEHRQDYLAQVKRVLSDREEK